MRAEARRLSPVRLALTVLVPCAAFYFFVYLGLLTAGATALMSAMGHGRQSRPETFAIIGAVTLGGLLATVLLTLALERWTFGPRATRIGAGHFRPAATRLTTAAIIVLLPPVGIKAWPEYDFRRTLDEARSARDDGSRAEAIARLGSLGDPRALPLIRELATEASPLHRSAAIGALAGIPGGKEVLLDLSRSPDPKVRQEAGRTLARLAAEPDVWAAVQLLLNDPDPEVRLSMTEAIATQPLPPVRRGEADELIRGRLSDVDPTVRLGAARRLGGERKDPAGYASAMAVLMDTSLAHETRLAAISTLGAVKDTRAAPLLWRISAGRSEAGFVPDELEERFRRAATDALGNLFVSSVPKEYPPIWRNEQVAIIDVGDVIRAEFKYRDAAGFFEGRLQCLDTPAQCLSPGQDLDLRFDPPLAARAERNGYRRTFHPGPPAAAGEIARPGGSPTSVTSWAYVAVPVRPGETGFRAFCGDDTGRICFTRDASPPPLREGRCPDSRGEPLKRPPGQEVNAGPPRPCLPASP